MKQFLLGAVLALFACSAFARELTPQEALSNAMTKLSNGAASAKGMVSQSMTLSYTESGTGGTPLYYVFNRTNGGFLIAGADSRSTGLLGYTDNGDFDAAKENPAFQSWLADCTAALQWLSEQSESRATSGSAVTSLTTSVKPLLGNIKWSQNAPYNLQCPTRTSGSTTKTKQALTGCVATATAQVMYYYKWPETGQGSNTNTNGESTDPNYTVDFSQSHYDWGSMKDTYDANETGVSADAVAKLMADLGCALNMYYTYDGSGSTEFWALKALATYFGYDKGAKYEERTYYTTDEWNNLLRNELDNSRPIIMGGVSSDGNGHAFVLDGYDTNGLYHVNWGWGGSSNGYFDINYMNSDIQGKGDSTSKAGYNLFQDVVIGIKKDEAGTSTAATSLRIIGQIMYDDDTKKFNYYVQNCGIEDFTGTLGFIIYNTAGKEVARSTLSRAKTPLPSESYTKLTYSIPSSVTIKEDYYIMPYYIPAGGTDVTEIPSQAIACKCLYAYKETPTAKTFSWEYPDSMTPELIYSNLKIVRNYTGYAPKAAVTIKNSSTTLEYSGAIYMYVTKSISDKTGEDEDTGYCYGATQVFLEPGETKDLELDCCFDYYNSESSTYSYKDMTDGTYDYNIYYEIGGYNCYLFDASGTSYASGTITMSTPAAGKLSYSDFKVDKSTLKQGETLTASFTATNSEGFTQNDYAFIIFRNIGVTNVAYIDVSAADLFGDTGNTVSMSKTMDLDPGSYFGLFYIVKNGGYTRISPANVKYSFTVTAATAIRDVNAEVDNKAALIYDVTGRRVQEMKKGRLYIINGKKVIY